MKLNEWRSNLRVDDVDACDWVSSQLDQAGTNHTAAFIRLDRNAVVEFFVTTPIGLFKAHWDPDANQQTPLDGEPRGVLESSIIPWSAVHIEVTARLEPVYQRSRQTKWRLKLQGEEISSTVYLSDSSDAVLAMATDCLRYRVGELPT